MALIGLTDDPIEQRKRLAQVLMNKGLDSSPVQHWTQGASRLANVLAGQMQMGRAASEQKGQSDRLLQAMIGQGGAPSPSAPSMEPMRLSPPQKPVDPTSYRDRIGGIESGGQQDPYQTLGPATKTGDRAHGKYGIMGANIPDWTEAHLGSPLTPDEFLKSPDAQDQVFDAQFGQYVDKYGPDGAARAWFAGEGGMDDPARKDVLGTSVADYSRKFAQAGPDRVYDAAPVSQGSQSIQIPPAIQQQIGQLWQAGPQGQKLAMQLYSQYAKPREAPKPTDDVREYEFARRQGYQGSFMEFMTDVRKAGATNVTVGGGKYGTIPPGFELVEGPEGATMRPIPGSPAARKAQEAKEQEAGRQAAVKRTGDIVLDDINRSMAMIETSDFPTTGLAGSLTQAVPGTSAHDLSNLLDTVKSNIGFDKLQAMRDASPTGGALGQVSEFENRLLQATFGALTQSQSKEQLLYNLNRVRDLYLDIVHGPGNRPAAPEPAQEDDGWEDRGNGVRIREKR